MSKKDLLERLTRAPSDAPRPRREDVVAPGRTGEPVQTDRVRPGVVRRRRVEAQEEAVTPTVVRRRAVVVSEEPGAKGPAEQGAAGAQPERKAAPDSTRSGDKVRRRKPEADEAEAEASAHQEAAGEAAEPAHAEPAESARADRADEDSHVSVPARSEAPSAEARQANPAVPEPPQPTSTSDEASARAPESSRPETAGQAAASETAAPESTAPPVNQAAEPVEVVELQRPEETQQSRDTQAREPQSGREAPGRDPGKGREPQGREPQKGPQPQRGRGREGQKAQLIHSGRPPEQLPQGNQMQGRGPKGPGPQGSGPQGGPAQQGAAAKPGARGPAQQPGREQPGRAPAGREPAREPAAREAAGQPSRAEAPREAAVEAQQPAKAPETRPEPARAEQGRTEPARAEQGRAEPTRAEAPREPTRPQGPTSHKAQLIRAPEGQEPRRPGSPTNEGPPAGRPPAEPPRYPGLGPAVVRPPPGYDPTNPQAFRRKQEADRAAAAPAADRRGPPGGRRRMDNPQQQGPDFRTPQPAPAQPADAQRRRRGGAAAAPSRVMERPFRTKRPKKMSGPKAASPAMKAQKRKVKVDNTISVGQLAHELGVKAPVVIRQLMDLGLQANITQMLDMDTAALVAAEFDYEVENVGFQEQNYLEAVPEAAEEEGVQPRPPVVTIMGHVDHGKTTLLDTIRKARVAAGEAGGITQHVGAYQVETDNGIVTFIDTPGHAAFTAMRARGAQVTDIVVLVVAADDGVQPQTIEAIQHAKAANVPIVVAVNKMDKQGASMDPIMTRLSEQGLTPELWGGDTMYVGVSALKGEGIDDLLETILLQSEVLGLKANPDRFAEGVVLEAKMERGRGAVATVLIQRGTLKRGDHVVLGSAYGKVRAIVGSKGDNLKEATPSTPVELFGLSELPEVGDSVHAVKSEQNARALAEHRAIAKREIAQAAHRKKTADDLFASANAEDRVIFHVILKADVGGSLQALKGAIEQISVPGAECRILASAVGDVNESDVNLAAANQANIIGFNVKLDAKARQAASQLGIEPEFYSVIYEVLDRIERGLKGMLAPVYEQVRVGTVEVRQIFKISKVGTVAGSYVLDGKVSRNNFAKVMRDGKLIWEGKVHSLRRFKDDVREVTAGHECGVSLEGFEDLLAGDLIEVYAEQLVEA